MKKIIEFIKSNKVSIVIVSALKKTGIFFAMVWSKIVLFFKSEKAQKVLSSKVIFNVILVLVILFALAEAVFGVMIYGFKSDSKATRIAASIIPFPAAIANQDFVTYSNYLSERDYIHHFYQSTGQENIDYVEIDKQILDQLVENKLIAFQAMVKKSHVKKEDVDVAVKEIVDQNGGDEKVNKVLSDLYGLNLNQFKKLVRTQMVRDQLDKDIITRVTASHILIQVPKDASDDKANAAKAKIDSVYAEVKGGSDFGEAAKKYSEDTGSAEQGGALESFASGEMVPEFSQVAFSTKAGEISEPFRTEFGWHIVKVESKTGKIDKSFSDWLSDLKKKSLIHKFI